MEYSYKNSDIIQILYKQHLNCKWTIPKINTCKQDVSRIDFFRIISFFGLIHTLKFYIPSWEVLNEFH